MSFMLLKRYFHDILALIRKESEFIMDVGQKIKVLREEKGMTLEELGDKVGVGKSTVRKWEAGIIANMRRDKIAKIADALGTSPAYLMGWEEESNTADTLLEAYDSGLASDAQFKRLMEYYKKLNQADRDMIENMAKRCAEK